MPIGSSDIPQADNIEDVVLTVESVAQGARTYQEIATFINKVGRQGRYYRKAAEILGLIHPSGKNNSLLTRRGRAFIRSNEQVRRRILIESVLGSQIIRRLVPYLELHPEGLTRENVVRFLSQLTPHIGDSMLPRRVSTIISWLTSLNIIAEIDGRYVLGESTRDIRILEFTNNDELIIPIMGELGEYNIVQQRAAQARSSIVIQQNQVAMERANNAHKSLVDLVAARIRNAGAIPRSNQLIDLATRYNSQSFIFEMKSTTQKNIRDQIRKGMSQLYEYRYLQNNPNAILVLVIDNPLPRENVWMRDYLNGDRQIYFLWDGKGSLFSTTEVKTELNFLF